MQYHTARNLTLLSIILHEKYEYLGENKTKNKTILTHWSVAQASSNDEKNWGSKISLDCPFKSRIFIIIKHQLQASSITHPPSPPRTFLAHLRTTQSVKEGDLKTVQLFINIQREYCILNSTSVYKHPETILYT